MTDRRHLRRRLLLLGVVPLLASGALGLKVGWMEHHNGAGASSLTAGDAGDARQAYATGSRINVLEPWVAPYDEGVAAFVQGEAADAVALFDRALEVAPVEEECRVRTNLALAKELQADAVGAADLARARLTWLEGRQVLERCLTVEPASVDRDVVAKVDERLARKLADAAKLLEQEQSEPEPPQPAEDLTPAEELERLNDEAREIRKRYQREEERPPQPRTSEGPVYNW